MSKLKTLQDCLIEQLKDLHSAEKQLVKALPKLVKKATNEKLKLAFSAHLEETKQQVERLDEISTILDKKLSGKTCKAMKGLIEEGEEILEKESENSALIDVLLVAAAQRVEHYEISAYGTTVAIAEELDLPEVVELLKATLDEEGEANKKLTAVTKKELFAEAIEFADKDEESEQPKRSSAKNERGTLSSSTTYALIIGGLFFSSLLLGSFASVAADPAANENSSRAAFGVDSENTKLNKRDQTTNSITAEDQSNKPEDLAILAKIRTAVMEDDSLSVNAQNVKIIVNSQKVYLRGPVDNVKERDSIALKAKKCAPKHEIVNLLEVSK